MNSSKENHKHVGQNVNLVKKPQKHDTNLQKNSTLYFQVGLILCLLTSYGLLEMDFKIKTFVVEDPYVIEPEEDLYVIHIPEEPKIVPKETSIPHKRQKITNRIKIV